MKRLICFFLLLIVSLLEAPCCLGVAPDRFNGFLVEFKLENNLFPATISLDAFDEALADLGELPAEAFYHKYISLSLPLWRGKNRVFGISYRQSARYQTTGETLDYYRCLAEAADPQENKYYALQAAYFEYSQLGGYYAQKWVRDSFFMVLRGDLFLCYDFSKLDILGQGRIKYQFTGTKQYELYANYQWDWLDPESPWGWGLNLDGNFNYSHSNLSLDLVLQNLLGSLYFKELRRDSGWVDTKEASIGLLPIMGFTREDSFYYRLPLSITLQAAYTLEYGGVVAADLFAQGENRDFVFSYRHPVGVINLLTSLHPDMKSVGFGMAGNYGELIFIFGWNTPSLKGINLKLQI
ncbi:MAG: hypothetical protein GX770_00665 [Firmicutes bacterium]|nr:hypothetical protein [Bacillota bacterium]